MSSDKYNRNFTVLMIMSIFLFIVLSESIGTAEEQVDQVISKIANCAGKITDLRASGTFESLLIKRFGYDFLEEKQSGSFAYTAVGSDYRRLDRIFLEAVGSGAIADTLFTSPYLCVWNECLSDSKPTDPLNKVWNNKKCVRSSVLQEENLSIHTQLSPFEILNFITIIPQEVVKTQSEQDILIRLATPHELHDAKWGLQISHPINAVGASSPMNLRGLLACELRTLDPCDVGYVSSSLLQPDGTKDLAYEIRLSGSLVHSDVSMCIPREVEFLEYSIMGSRKGKVLRSATLKIDELEINTGITSSELIPAIPND